VTSTGLTPATVHDAGLLLLRLTAGGFLLPHGLGKLFGWLGGPGLAGFALELREHGLPAASPVPMLLASLQTLAGALLVVGLWTRGSALVAAGFLATTVVLNRANGWYWMRGGIEYPLLWTLVVLGIALLGPGQFSLDTLIRSRTGAPA
jgi:putative oxidoreductase